jgi:hypothetical protein
MVQEPIQYRAGQGAVIVEDFGPVFIRLVGGQQDGRGKKTERSVFPPLSLSVFQFLTLSAFSLYA